MNDLKGLRAVVAGAGAIGSVLAVQLARRGADVVLADPRRPGDNASGVAAGMLAPVFETLLDPASADLHPHLLAGRDGWPELMDLLTDAPPLDRSGALLQLPDAAAAEAMLAKLKALGAAGRSVDKGEAGRWVPGLAGPGEVFVFTPDDWRLEAGPTLAALHAALIRLGGRQRTAAVTGFESGVARLDDGGAPCR